MFFKNIEEFYNELEDRGSDFGFFIKMAYHVENTTPHDDNFSSDIHDLANMSSIVANQETETTFKIENFNKLQEIYNEEKAIIIDKFTNKYFKRGG